MKTKYLLLLVVFLLPTSANANRLWSSGCELQGDSGGNQTADLEFYNQDETAPGRITIDTTTKRTGLSACRVDQDPAAGGGRFGIQVTASTLATDLYAREYIYINTMPTSTAATIIMHFWDVGVDAYEGGIRLNTTGTLTWYDDDGLNIATSSAALTTGQWYRIEVNYDAADAVEVKIDGTLEINIGAHTGDAIDSVAFGICSSGTPNPSGGLCTGDIYFDDLAVNDTSGTAQTAYPGAGSIVHMQPDGAGDANGCLSGDATSVDEITPDDATTICVLDADTGGDVLDTTAESSSSAGIDSYDPITLVQVGTRTSRAAIGTAVFQPRIKSVSGGTTTSGSSVTLTTTVYATNDDTVPRTYFLTSHTDPTTAVAWTPTGTNSLDNMQIGVNLSDGNPDVNFSTLWALVEYVDGAAPSNPMLVD